MGSGACQTSSMSNVNSMLFVLKYYPNLGVFFKKRYVCVLCELKLVLVHCASLGFSSTVRVCVTVKYVLELP